jgi:hypothetical protein
MNENMPNETMNDRFAIVMAMHRIPRTVREVSITESPNVVDGRMAFARKSKLAEYLADDCCG